MAVLSKTRGGRKVTMLAEPLNTQQANHQENIMRMLILFLLTALALPALADDPKGAPTRKHGLWEMTMEHQGGHKMTMRNCVGPGSYSVSQPQGGPGADGKKMRKQQNCRKHTVSRQSGKVEMDS